MIDWRNQDFKAITFWAPDFHPSLFHLTCAEQKGEGVERWVEILSIELLDCILKDVIHEMHLQHTERTFQKCSKIPQICCGIPSDNDKFEAEYGCSSLVPSFL